MFLRLCILAGGGYNGLQGQENAAEHNTRNYKDKPNEEEPGGLREVGERS